MCVLLKQCESTTRIPIPEQSIWEAGSTYKAIDCFKLTARPSVHRQLHRFHHNSSPVCTNCFAAMVYYFTTKNGDYTIYMGKDKYENEDLIKYGLPEDCWFHVDDLSSAHVYLRLKPGMTLDDIPQDLLLECATLVKANSIQGCKVRYTVLQHACRAPFVHRCST